MKTKIFLLSLVLTLLFASPAFAQTPSRSQFKKELKEDKKELKKDIKEVRQENRIRLSETKKNQVEKIYNQLKEQLAKRFNFLEASLAKLDKKITDKKAKGITIPDLTLLRTDYNNAKTKYASDLAALETQYQAMLVADKPLSLMSQLRQAGNTVRTDLLVMQKALVSLIRTVSQAR